jgi:sortase A
VPLTDVERFLLDALERMRGPNVVTENPADQALARWRIRIGVRFAPFFSRLANYRLSGINRLLGLSGGHWPRALLLAGSLLLAYVGAQYLSMWHEQHVFAEEWTRQSSASSVTAPIFVDGESGIARLTIPKIDLRAVVIEGTSYRALKAGPGHLRHTPLPGDSGNAVLAGHRDTFFRHLNDLVPGDSIVIERQGHTYQFAVTGREIVDPGDVSVLGSSPEAILTLITCYPPHFIGPAPKRLVVIGKLASQAESHFSQAH